MEGRRGKRGGGGNDASPRSSGRTSPARKASPSRKASPPRKTSPARKASPSRKASPARKTSPPPKVRRSTSRPQSTTQRRSARKKNEVDVLPEVDETTISTGQVLKLRLSPLKLDKLNEGKIKKGAKVTNISSEGDDEVAQLTAKNLHTVADKLTNNLTPSASEFSKGYSRSISRSVLDDEEWSNSDHSDRNDDMYANRITRSRSKTTGSYLHRREAKSAGDAVSEWGGRYAATALTIILPIICILLQYICSRPDCNLKALRSKKLLELSTYFTLEAGYIYIGHAWLLHLLSAIPYTGHRKKLTGSNSAELEHYFNGLASAILIITGLGVAEFWFKYPIVALIYKNYQQLCVISVVYALIISIWCFVRANYIPNAQWNSHGKSGRVLSDLFIGRETNPRWFDIIDIKLVHLRLALITTLVFNTIFLVRNVQFAPLPTAGVNESVSITDICLHIIQNAKFDAVAAVTAILIIAFILDILIFEHHLTSSYELQCEGVGSQLLLRYALLPIWTSLISKFALQHKIPGVPNWALAIISIVFVAGIILKRLSNELKYHYRINPNSKRSTSKCILRQFIFPIISYLFKTKIIYTCKLFKTNS